MFARDVVDTLLIEQYLAGIAYQLLLFDWREHNRQGSDYDCRVLEWVDYSEENINWPQNHYPLAEFIRTVYNFLRPIKNLSHFLVHIFGWYLVFEGEQSVFLQSQLLQLSIEHVVLILSRTAMDLHIEFIENFVLAVDLLSNEVEVEIATGAHQLSHISLLKYTTLYF